MAGQVTDKLKLSVDAEEVTVDSQGSLQVTLSGVSELTCRCKGS